MRTERKSSRVPSCCRPFTRTSSSTASAGNTPGACSGHSTKFSPSPSKYSVRPKSQASSSSLSRYRSSVNRTALAFVALNQSERGTDGIFCDIPGRTQGLHQGGFSRAHLALQCHHTRGNRPAFCRPKHLRQGRNQLFRSCGQALQIKRPGGPHAPQRLVLCHGNRYEMGSNSTQGMITSSKEMPPCWNVSRKYWAKWL